MEEVLPLLPPGMQHQVLDFGLHVNPGKLRGTLQDVVDANGGKFDTILLGYGLCSQAVIGLKANGCRLVAPRVDDCIALFLGSRTAYLTQNQAEPGTYYLTRGWIEVGDTPFFEYERSVQRYGKERADLIYKMLMGNYKRLALIHTGGDGMEGARKYARQTAERFGLIYEEIEGSDTLVRKMLYGPWDDSFVVLEPGETFTLQQFLPVDGAA